MKKSSLLAVSLVSLVALVGCSKQQSAQKKMLSEEWNEKLDAHWLEVYEKLGENIPPAPLAAKVTYSLERKGSGSYAPATLKKTTVKFTISREDSTSLWVAASEDFDEEDAAFFSEEINDLYSSWGEMFGYTLPAPDDYYNFYWNPIAFQYHSEGSGETSTNPDGSPIVDDQGNQVTVAFDYTYSKKYTYNDNGFLTSYVEKKHEEDVCEAYAPESGVIDETRSISFKYTAFEELEA